MKDFMISRKVDKIVRYSLGVLKSPIATALRVLRGPMAQATYLISRTLGIPRKTIKAYYKEFYNDVFGYYYLQKMITEARKREPKVGGWIDLNLSFFLYALTRIFRPRIVVETGVGPGCSSAVILNALEKNKIKLSIFN